MFSFSCTPWELEAKFCPAQKLVGKGIFLGKTCILASLRDQENPMISVFQLLCLTQCVTSAIYHCSTKSSRAQPVWKLLPKSSCTTATSTSGSPQRNPVISPSFVFINRTPPAWAQVKPDLEKCLLLATAFCSSAKTNQYCCINEILHISGKRKSIKQK